MDAQTQVTMAGMSRAQKVGQAMMIGFDGLVVTPELRAMIEQYHIGGVILFARNVQSPTQVAYLTRDLQALARASDHPGLLIAIDQEGGRVARLTEATGFTEFPSALAIGATGDPANAMALAQIMGRELRAVGINTNFAPVLDVNNNPRNPVIGTRSYGSAPDQVASFGLATIAALEREGVLAFGKHFPGHGDTSVDSHFALPRIAHARAHLEACEFIPFKAAIANGIAGIMSAHVLFPGIEPAPGRPATLSEAVLTGLLRDELHYEGLLVTDSLEMLALAMAGYPPPQAAAAALQAGADVLLFNAGYADHRAAFHLILDQVEQGRIPVARLDTAVSRILHAKVRFGLLEPEPVDVEAAAGKVGTPEHRSQALAVARQSITVLRDEAGLLPLVSDRDVFVLELPSPVGLANHLHLPMLADPEISHAAVLAAAARVQIMIVGIIATALDPAEVALVQALLAARTPVVLVALRDPYDLLLFPHAPTMIVTYGSSSLALRGLASVITGQSAPHGQLPVELPGLFPRGASLQALGGHCS